MLYFHISSNTTHKISFPIGAIMIKNLFNFFLFIFMTGLFFQCENKQEVTPSAEFDLETAKIISHLPAGVLEPESAIKIRFVNNQIDKEQVSDTEEHHVVVVVLFTAPKCEADNNRHPDNNYPQGEHHQKCGRGDSVIRSGGGNS